MNKIKNGAFKEGYVVNKIKHNPPKDKPTNFDDLYYPNGIIPFIFLLFLLLGGMLTVMLVAWKMDNIYFHLKWQNYLVSVPGVTLCMNLFWLIARTGIFNSFGYFGLKIGRITRFSNLKEKVHITPINSAMSNIKSYADFNQYVSIRQKHTKKFLYISLAIHGAIFLISIIILLIVDFI